MAMPSRPEHPAPTEGHRRKAQFSIYLEPEQLEKLRGLSKRTRVAVAIYVRDGVDLILKQHEGATAPAEEGA